MINLGLTHPSSTVDHQSRTVDWPLYHLYAVATMSIDKLHKMFTATKNELGRTLQQLEVFWTE